MLAVARRSLILLGVLALLWGASFLFIKVAVDGHMSPVVVAAVRSVIGAATVALCLAAIPATRTAAAAPGVAATPRPSRWLLALVGLCNAALPFTLIAYGETRIDSGLASILNAGVPLFTAVLAIRLDEASRVRGWRALGLLIGFAGIVVLVGPSALGSGGDLLGELAIVAATLAYALGGIVGRRAFVGRSGAEGALLANVWACAWLVGPAAVVLVATLLTGGAAPTLAAWGAVAALGVLGTGMAHVLFYSLLQREGATRTTMVTYLVPPTALVYGSLLLDEPVRAGQIGGLVLILAGVAWMSVRVGGRRVAQPGVDTSPPITTTTVAEPAPATGVAGRGPGSAGTPRVRATSRAEPARSPE